MTIQQRFSFLFKRWGMFLFCLLASVLPVWAGSFIKDQPEDLLVCENVGGVSFSLTVNGELNRYTFRWHKMGISGWMPITGPVGGGQSLTPLSPQEGTYMCIVTETATSRTEQSNTVTLTIDKAPTITNIVIPAVCNGDILNAWVDDDAVKTNGRDLISYVWKLRGDSIEGNKITDNKVPKLSFVANSTQHNNYLTLTVRNTCGSSNSPPKAITVHSTPQLPEPIVKDYYCQGEKPPPLSTRGPIEAVWFNRDGENIPPPIPDTDKTGIQKWWVLHRIAYTDFGNPVCLSDTVVAKAEIFAKPAPPERDAEISLCVNDPGITLQTKGGSNIKWYNEMQKLLTTPPQINTSKIEKQEYYVTQNNGKCESTIDQGKITVYIRDVANADNIVLSYNPELCPNSSTIIEVRSGAANPIFYWYANSNKTVPITTPGNGSIFETPVLSKDTAYYVTLKYGTSCESTYAQAAVLNVRDIIPPKITAPHNVVVNTNDGVCYATNVDAGFPIVSDNCTPANRLIVTSNPEVDLTTRFEVGDTTLIWWVKDESELMDYALQNISVRDRQKPWPTVPVQDIVKEIDENENSAIAFYDWKYEDNCTPTSELIDSLYRGLPSGSEFPLGETQIIRYIMDKSGNVDTCRFKVIVRHPFRDIQVNLKWNRNPICPGQEVVITPEVSGGTGRVTYSWSPRPWTAQVMRDYPLDDTNYEVTVSDGLTTITKNLFIEVLTTRQVELSLSVEGRSISMDDIFEGDEVLVTASPGFEAYKLMLNNEIIQEAGMNNYVSFQADLGTYVVRVFATDENFCVTQEQMIIEVESNKIPNVFTPNFDGKNDVFLEFLETPIAPQNFELLIYSRAGELLYKGNKGWDGIYKGKVLPQGTYSYIARRKMNNGEYRTFKGTVTLKQ